MTKKTFFTAPLAFVISVAFLIPSLSFAASTVTTSYINPQQALIQQLTQEIAQLQTQLNALLNPSTPIIPIALVSIPVSTHVDQIGGRLRITFLGVEKVQTATSVASTSQLAQPLGDFLLDYSACPTTFCSNPANPTMHTQLWPGQSTTYMNETIFLNGFATTSPAALVTVTPAS